jgi:CubicO group peptidase (beta-lactamase class C family)
MVFIKEIPLSFEPGSRQEYSNIGYEVLGAIIESVTEQSYYDYVRENIYSPAGMTNTDAYETDHPVENLATGYMGADRNIENTLVHPVKGTAAGGGYSTAEDLLKFINAIHGNTLLSAEGSRQFRGMGIAGGLSGLNAAIEDDIAGHTIIVLSNYDPPIAERLARGISESLTH